MSPGRPGGRRATGEGIGWLAVAVVAGTASPREGIASTPDLPPAPLASWWQTFVLYRETLRWLGGAILALTALLVLAHFVVYGAHHVRPTGRLVRRYRWPEVLLHAVLALAFVGAWGSSTYLILARYLLGFHGTGVGIPLGRLSSALHVAAGLAFLGALLALAAVWRRSMRFADYDAGWLRALGGYFSRRHRILPAGRFNAGQKVWFRVAVLLGVLVALSGGLIYYPGVLGPAAGVALYMAHTLLAVALSAAVIAHVYLGTLAHPCAARSMITGEIDEACLREDHPLEPILGRAAIPGPGDRASGSGELPREAPRA